MEIAKHISYFDIIALVDENIMQIEFFTWVRKFPGSGIERKTFWIKLLTRFRFSYIDGFQNLCNLDEGELYFCKP